MTSPFTPWIVRALAVFAVLSVITLSWFLLTENPQSRPSEKNAAAPQELEPAKNLAPAVESPAPHAESPEAEASAANADEDRQPRKAADNDDPVLAMALALAPQIRNGAPRAPRAIVNPPNLLLEEEAPLTPRQVADRLAAENRVIRHNQQRNDRVAAWLAAADADTLEEIERLRMDGILVHDIENGRPVFIGPSNWRAAVSTAANLVRDQPEFANVQGQGITIGVWEPNEQAVFHPEWNDRMTWREPGNNRASPQAFLDHAAHVTGTLISAGQFRSGSRGMAPAARVDLYTADDDTVEMLAAAAATQADFNLGSITLSNHFYARLTAWDLRWLNFRSWQRFWFGEWPLPPGQNEDGAVGQYNQNTANFDDVCWARPRFLPFVAASNNREDTRPRDGFPCSATLTGTQPPRFARFSYNSDLHPPGSPDVEDGYDTIPDFQNAKNIMTVGAVTDAWIITRDPETSEILSAVRDLGSARLASFTSFGPADDGRVKPDIIAHGVNLYSTLDTSRTPDQISDEDYARFSGTSMASPNACGSAALLVDLYRQRFSGFVPLASTLKG